MATVIADALSDLEQRLLDSQGEVRIDGSLPSVDADPMQLGQLMQNLIGNALKYRSPETAPKVRVSCTESRAGWAIEVSDNGIGFAEDQADRIFAPFQRLHGRGEYEGTGMGLAICRRIVERHHGTISAHASPGAGARFVVTLPRAASRLATS
jgi:signal transduction histidine kinase